MDIMETMRARHAVRSYDERPIEAEVREALQCEIDACNKEGKLNIQLVCDDPAAFDGMMAHYGKFSGVRNYLALIGKKAPDLEERCGYYGERLVLAAQQLGLNSCWVAMTFSKGAAKRAVKLDAGEKLVIVISLGYGKTQGMEHKSKATSELCRVEGEMPDWFAAGMEAAALAPTAMNQQKFRITLDGDEARAENLGGFYSNIDLGIVKYHFEAASGHKLL